MSIPKTIRWVLLWIGILALVLVPFFLFGGKIEAWTKEFVESAGQRPLAAGATLSALLASDILLPIPSSMVSTACGCLLGFAWGTLASLAGMIASCIAGYWLGYGAGRGAATGLIKPDELTAMNGLIRRFGDWAIVVCRPVPVLAEASVLFLGISRVPFGRFLLLSTLSNLGISAVYAAIGAFSVSAGSFLFAFVGAVAIPGLAMLLMRRR